MDSDDLAPPGQQAIPLIDPSTGEIYQAPIFVAVLGASSLTFVMASVSLETARLDRRPSSGAGYFGGVTRAIVCDNLKAGVAKALWFESTLNQTFAAMADHYELADP